MVAKFSGTEWPKWCSENVYTVHLGLFSKYDKTMSKNKLDNIMLESLRYFSKGDVIYAVTHIDLRTAIQRTSVSHTCLKYEQYPKNSRYWFYLIQI